jgi:hypothetical protein
VTMYAKDWRELFDKMMKDGDEIRIHRAEGFQTGRAQLVMEAVKIDEKTKVPKFGVVRVVGDIDGRWDVGADRAMWIMMAFSTVLAELRKEEGRRKQIVESKFKR